MAKKSAGLLIYRFTGTSLEVFLVHPGGPFWKNKDEGAWSIPKGEMKEGEPGLEAALRETHEETGYLIHGEFIELSPVKQKSGKLIYAWAVYADIDANAIKSNNFEMDWPPGSGISKSFPEVDRAGWFNKEEAELKMLTAQWPLLQELENKLRRTGK